MDKRLRYPIGVQSFEKIRKEGYVYVDKTMYIRDLLDNDYYFLSRPRRFGKSLFLSTLEAYFKGRKELFEGLAVSEWERDWVEYPVIRIDFAAMPGHDTVELVKSLRLSLYDTARSYGIDTSEDVWRPDEYGVGDVFSVLIDRLATKYNRKVVVLVDEYDKGLIETIHDETLMAKAADVLRPFFSVLKSQDDKIRFAFITGVSRFRNTTIFSGANNLRDISMSNRFATLCGITHVELEVYFDLEIRSMGKSLGIEDAYMYALLKNKYDGYRFASGEEYVYNPFSLLNALNERELRDYWVMSGTSRILAQYLKGSGFSLEDLTSKSVSGNTLAMAYSRENPMSLFYQTGYLTIREASFPDTYKLSIPNQEVQAALSELLIPMYVVGYSETAVVDLRLRLYESVYSGDVDSMMTLLRALLSSVPYNDIDLKVQEKHLHLCMYMIFMMLGTATKCEVASASGRMDMVASTPWRIYVFEFKIDGSAQDALRQIEEKGYAVPWESDGRTVTKIGVNFSTVTRTIESWIAATE